MAGLYAMLIGLSLLSVLNIRFDFDFEAFLAANDPDRDYYVTFKNQFEPDDNQTLVALENHSGIFDTAFLEKVDRFTKDCLDLPYVEKSFSLTNLKRPRMIGGLMGTVPYLHIRGSREQIQRDSVRIMSDPTLPGRFVSYDARSLTVVFKTKNTLNAGQSVELEDALADLLNRYSFDNYHVASRAHYQVLFIRKETRDFFLYSGLATLIIIIILSLSFRRVMGVVIAVGSVIVGMILFMGFLGVAQPVLDPMSTLFPILMVIVGMSDVVHIMSKYVEELDRGLESRQAMRVTIREIGMATLLTSLTTAVGFTSLLSSNILPIRKFGLTAAAGVIIAFITVITLTTTLLTWFSRDQLISLKHSQNNWKKLTGWIHRFTLTNVRGIGIGTLLLLVLCIVGVMRISGNIHMENSFPKMEKVHRDFRFFEHHMGGIRPFEMAALAKGRYSMDDYELMRDMDRLQTFLEKETELNSVISPAVLYRTLNCGLHGDNPEYYKFPESQVEFEKYRKLLKRAPFTQLNVLLNEKHTMGRITARYLDHGSDAGFALRDSINRWVHKNLDTRKAEYRHTGISLLLDKNGVNIRYNMFRGLAIAFLAVSLIMALLFRDLKMVLISLIPNIIPILIGGAVVGFFNIEMDAPASINFAVAFGIAVDDTIHFLTRYRLEKRKGKSNIEAIEITFRETGKAIILTSIILFFGFGILITSNYPPTYTIGLLITITLSSALVADLLLTPVLIYALKGKNGKKKTA